MTEEIKQPKPGDCVVYCPHLKGGFGGKVHWYECQGTSFNRPDGTIGFARWIVQCPACHESVQAGGPPSGGGDMLWPADGRLEDGTPYSNPVIDEAL